MPEEQILWGVDYMHLADTGYSPGPCSRMHPDLDRAEGREPHRIDWHTALGMGVMADAEVPGFLPVHQSKVADL